jgi:glycosyltransferase involved in cell wall biosynthesis
LYNCGSYIKRCLQSIQKQSILGKYEVIVVDDGSVDDGCSVVEEMLAKDDRIKLIKQNNAGCGMARNAALEMVTGKYVYFVDADDILIPNSLSSPLKMMESHNLDAINVQAYSVKDGDSQLPPPLTNTRDAEELEICSGIDYLKRTNLVRTGKANVWRYLYRRDVIESNNLKFVHFAAEDHVFNINFFMCAQNVGVCTDSVYVWVLYPNSTSHRYKPYEDCYQMGEGWLEQHDLWYEKNFDNLVSHEMQELAQANKSRIVFDNMIWPMIRESISPSKAIRVINRMKSLGLYPIDKSSKYIGLSYKGRSKIFSTLWCLSRCYPAWIAAICLNWGLRSNLKKYSSRRSER